MDSISGNALLGVVSSMSSISTDNIVILAASVVLGVIVCFLGLKVMKFISAIIGFVIGIGIGAVIGSVADITGFTYLILMFGCAILIGVLSFFIYRVSVFVFAFFVFFATIVVVIGSGTSMVYVIAAAVGFVFGIIAIIFMEPMIIVVTAIWGGLCAGDGIAQLAKLSNASTMGFVIGGGLAIVGMLLQYLFFAKKGKRRKKDRGEHVDTLKEKEEVETDDDMYDDYE